MDLQNQAQKCFVNFKRLVDNDVVLHGSFSNGTYSYDSDIDLITDIPLDKIQKLVDSNRKSGISVINYIHNTKIPRLVLFDSQYGFQLDLVNLKKQSCELKDAIISQIVKSDDIVLKCIQRLKKWRKQYSFIMEPSKGYPNNQVFQIILFQVMMKMKIVPFLDGNNQFITTDFVKSTDISVNQVINNFMRFLSVVENQEIVSLYNISGLRSSNTWVIEDPKGNVFNCMKHEVPWNVSVCAQNYLTFKSFEESYQLINHWLEEENTSVKDKVEEGFNWTHCQEDFGEQERAREVQCKENETFYSKDFESAKFIISSL